MKRERCRVAVCLLLLAGCQAEPPPASQQEPAGPSAVVTVTDDDFAQLVLASQQPVLLDCWAPWCQPCREQGPIVEALARQFEGRAVVAKLNVDQQRQIARRYEIRGIPTLLFFKEGRLVGRLEGLRSHRELSRQLNGLVGDPGAEP